MMQDDKVIPVRVAIRSRPLIPKETNEGCQNCLSFTSGDPQIIIGKDRAFTYDYVFSPTNTQTDVYNYAVFPLIKHIFKGYNATVLAYGQTGSGKTFTMGGCYESSLREDLNEMGVIPRVLRELFNGIEKIEDTEFNVKVSYLEIHNEDINDLLSSPSKREPLTIREDIAGEIKLPGLREVEVKTFQDTMNCLEKGSQGRTTGSTAMNTHSSRSHAIFTIIIEQRKREDMDDVCKSKFHLVDLAGSERAKRTQAVGERFKEGVNINRGLLALGNVISALGEEAQSRSYIPYRDSKLTRLLQDSLGGNSYTLMIACVSPADSNMEESLNTLRYADRARKIKNKPVVNRDPQAAEVHRLKQQVQQLQVQLLNGGIGVSSCSSSSSLSVVSSTEELKEMIQRNKLLEEENSKLSDELRQAVDQSTNMCEKAIKLEMKCDKLKERLQNLKKDTGVDFDVLSMSVDLDSNPTAKAQFEKLKLLMDKMMKDESEEEKESPMTTIDQEESENLEEALPSTPDSRAMSKEYALRQAKMGRELQELNKLLAKKEVLANQICKNDDEMKAMRQQYETQMKDLELEISLLQKEKETMQHALDDAKTNMNTNKVAEQRRVRLKELEHQITELRKKMTEQARMLKMKDTADKQVSKLNVDIQGLKSQRIRLMKQMKEESDEFRKWKQKKDKEVMQLMQKDRKRQFEIVKLQHENQKQQTILKRKSEEAAAANRRLKEALIKQKQVLAERSQKLEKYDSTTIGNRVRSWLSHELEVRVSIREAKYHLESLLSDRKSLCQQRKELREKVEDGTDGPPVKKLAWLAENGDKTECSFEIEEIKKEVNILDQEILQRNVQISDLQQKIVDADQDIKGKSTWESVHTMVEAKCALKWLLEQAVSAKADTSKLQGKLKDSEFSHNDNKDLINRLETELKESKSQQEQELIKQQKQHEEKVLFILRQMRIDNNVSLPDDVKERLQVQAIEIEKLSHLHEELQKKTDECEALKKQMTVAMYQNKTMALLPSIDDPGSSPFLTPKPKKKVHDSHLHFQKLADTDMMSYEEYLEINTDDSVIEDDDDKDEDWRMTPLCQRKRKSKSIDKKAEKTAKKNSSSSLLCKCKSNCGSKKCSCRNKGNKCGSECRCDAAKCKNREQDFNLTSDGENESASTLNSTYNLGEEEKEKFNVQPINIKASKPKHFVIPQIPKDDIRSSDEFIKSPLKQRNNKSMDTDSDNSGSSSSLVSGGVKKRRKILNSNSFFSPLV